MPSNFVSGAVDLDTLFAAHVTNNAANVTGYQVAGVDIQTRYDPLSNPAPANAGSRIPATTFATSATGYTANTDLASIFAGDITQYAVTVPTGGSLSTTGFISPKVWTHTTTVTFANAAALTSYFFYGGRILLSASQTAGSAADNALASMFTAMGSIIIYDTGHYQSGGAGGTVVNAGVGGSNIGTISTSLYTSTDSAPYSSSTYAINMVANLAAGSATVLTITRVLTLNTGNGGGGAAVVDTYTGTYSSSVSQRNHPTQTVPTFGGTLV